MRNARSRSAGGILRALGSRILRPLGQVVQDRTELYLLVQFPPLVDGFLQASGDRQVGRLDDVPAIRVAHHWHRQTPPSSPAACAFRPEPEPASHARLVSQNAPRARCGSRGCGDGARVRSRSSRRACRSGVAADVPTGCRAAGTPRILLALAEPRPPPAPGAGGTSPTPGPRSSDLTFVSRTRGMAWLAHPQAG